MNRTINLWCSHCYADHGQYHSPKSLMQESGVIAIIKRYLQVYDQIRVILFWEERRYCFNNLTFKPDHILFFFIVEINLVG